MCKCCGAIEFWKESEKDKNSKLFAKIAIYTWKEGKRRIKGKEYFNYTTRAYDLKYCPSCRKEAGGGQAMINEYYVIVDLYDLTYMKNGESVNLNEADKFETIEEAKNELKNYDEDFSGGIYKVVEYKSINLKKVDDKQ